MLRAAQPDSGDTTFDESPPGWQTFEEFLEAAPAWKGPDAYVFHVAKDVPLPQRAQPSGLSCIHAPLVVQRYLVSLHTRHTGMIDPTRLVRERFTARQLERYIFRDMGGNSRQILHDILEPGSHFKRGDGSYEDSLRRYGPGLVSEFEAHADFLAADRVSFDGKPIGRRASEHFGNASAHFRRDLHGMVLIGARRDRDTGKLWYLLQNWWPRSQFVEMSEEYFGACNPLVSFVGTPQTKIPEALPTQRHLIAETRDFDMPERGTITDSIYPRSKDEWSFGELGIGRLEDLEIIASRPENCLYDCWR